MIAFNLSLQILDISSRFLSVCQIWRE